MSTRHAFLAGAAALGAASFVIPASADDLTALRVIAFPGGGNGWPIWVAQTQGFFARECLAVTLTPTSGSIYQMSHLIAGDFDIAHTAADNVVAYSEGVGEAPVPPGTSLVAVMGGDNGLLHVLARPEYTTYAALRGKRIGVDALTTGFAFVLRAILAAAGLAPGTYELVPVGAGAKRYAALLANQIDATISSTPFDIAGAAAGLHVFENATQTIGAYQGYVATTTRAWAAQNSDVLTRYIRAYTAALDWLYDPAQRSAALALLVERGGLTPSVAESAAAILLDARAGYARHAELSVDGVARVIALRRAYGGAATPLREPEHYLDLAAFQAARQSVSMPV